MQWSNYPSYLYHSTPRFCLQWDFTRYLRWVTVSSFKMGQGVFELNIWGNGQSDMLLAIYEHAVRPTHPKHFLWWVMGSGERCVVVVLRVSTAIVLLLVVQSWSVALVVCQWHGTSTIQIQICIFFTGKERFHVSLCSLFINIYHIYMCRNIRSQWYIYVSPSSVFFHLIAITSITPRWGSVGGLWCRLYHSRFCLWHWSLDSTAHGALGLLADRFFFSENSKARQVAYVDRENINKR